MCRSQERRAAGGGSQLPRKQMGKKEEVGAAEAWGGKYRGEVVVEH